MLTAAQACLLAFVCVCVCVRPHAHVKGTAGRLLRESLRDINASTRSRASRTTRERTETPGIFRRQSRWHGARGGRRAGRRGTRGGAVLAAIKWVVLLVSLAKKHSQSGNYPQKRRVFRGSPSSATGSNPNLKPPMSCKLGLIRRGPFRNLPRESPKTRVHRHSQPQGRSLRSPPCCAHGGSGPRGVPWKRGKQSC